MGSKNKQRASSTKGKRTISLGALIAAAYEVVGSAEAVAKMLESPAMMRRIGSRRPLELLRSAA